MGKGTLGNSIRAILPAVAVGLWLLGFPGAASADHYTVENPPATIEPQEIPLWGPTWDHSPLTYVIEAGKGVTPEAIAMVEQAITDWNHAIAYGVGDPDFAFLVPVPEGASPDITIRPKSGGGMVQGQALCNSSDGFFTWCKVNISGKAFGSANPDDTVRSIAIQEIGHALGLLHSDNSLDVMYGTLQDPPNTRISFCDLDGWAAVMAWLLLGTTPAPPSVSSVSCGDVSGGGGGGDPAAVTVETDKASYVHGEQAKIKVTVTDGVNPVSGAAVTVTLTTANGRLLSGSSQTNDQGVANFTYKVNSKRDGVGTYTLDAEACKNDICANGSTTFEVE